MERLVPLFVRTGWSRLEDFECLVLDWGVNCCYASSILPVSPSWSFVQTRRRFHSMWNNLAPRGLPISDSDLSLQLGQLSRSALSWQVPNLAVCTQRQGDAGIFWPLGSVPPLYWLKSFHTGFPLLRCNWELRRRKILLCAYVLPGLQDPSLDRQQACLLLGPVLTVPSLFFFFFAVLGIELRVSHLLSRCSTTWSTLPALLCVAYFQDRVSQTLCPVWLQTTTLLITASWVARIIALSHWCPA
jgi:hypothetical protein